MEMIILKSSMLKLRLEEDTIRFIEIKWAQKARLQWLLNRDDNTKFFHVETKIRIRYNQILWLDSENGSTITDEKSIRIECKKYFENLWNSNVEPSLESFPTILPCISEEDNSHFIKVLHASTKKTILISQKSLTKKKKKLLFSQCQIIRTKDLMALDSIFTETLRKLRMS